MRKWLPRIHIESGETEHITYSGRRLRRPTVLIKIGRHSISKRAFLLGLLLVGCQLLDGLLTYIGLSVVGINMEGNQFLLELMHAYGAAPVLVGVKILAIILIVIITIPAHRRRWFRPVLVFLFLVYISVAVIPWIYILSNEHAKQSENRNW